MFKAFYWMFQHKDFKKQLIYTTLTPFLLILIAFGVLILARDFLNSVLGTQLNIVLGTILFLFPILYFNGYFWNLTEKIIDRKENVIMSNVYGGKITREIIIEFPEHNVFKHIWRGFASMIAGILSIVPYYLLLFGMVIGAFFRIAFVLSPWIIFIIYAVYLILLPLLAWNYAKSNSVLAMLDIPKGVRLLEQYPIRYLKTVSMLIFIFLINLAIDSVIYYVLTGNTVFLTIGLIINIIKSYYFLFVYAYLIGTMLPCDEF